MRRCRSSSATTPTPSSANTSPWSPRPARWPTASAGTYVSGRRWTLKLDGVDIRLPEVEPGAALARLVELERANRLLEKDIIAVDLRMPDRVVVRLTEEAAAARAEASKKTKKGTAT